MFRVIEHFKGVMPPVDSRSPRDVESDIDDEIAFHLEMKTRDLVTAGCEPSAARSVAQTQFGDIQAIKTKCKRIALKERIMLQRVNFVMMILVMALVLGLSYQIWTTQKKTNDALGMITTEIAHFRNADERAMSAAPRSPGLIYVDGIVARPGTYNMPGVGNLTMKRLIASAGGLTQGTSARVTVTTIDREGNSVVRFSSDQLFDDPQTDYMLAPNDHVLVQNLQAADALSAPRSGEWRQISESGTVTDQGAKLLLLSGEDPRNGSGVTSAVAQLAPSEGELGLMFRSGMEQNLILNERVDGGRRTIRCRWWPEGDDIMLDLNRARPSMSSPVRIRWISPADDKIDEFVSATGVLHGIQPRESPNAATTDLARSQLSVEEQRLRAETLSRFLQQVLTNANSAPQPAGGVSVRELLEHASKQVESDFANDPQTQTTLRELVAKSRAALEERDRVAGAAQNHEGRDDDDDAERDRLKRSPFEIVAWDEWTPYVRLENRWWRLESINDVKATDIIEHCRTVHSNVARKRFSEDLVQVLGEMGHAVGDTAKLGLVDLKTGAGLAVDAAAMTEKNRTQIWHVNNEAEAGDGNYPRFDPATGKGPELARPRADGQPRDLTLSREQALRDVDQLRRHLLDQFSYLRLKDVNLDAEIDAMRKGLAESIETNALALQMHRLICQFGDGHAGVIGLEQMLLGQGGFTPFLIGDADGRLVAFNEDRSALVDADHPYIRSIDGQPIDRWLELAGTITAKGSPQLQRSRAIRNLRLIKFLRGQADVAIRPTIDLELESIERDSVRTLSLPLSTSKPIYGEWPRTSSRLLDNNIGYMRLASMDDDAASDAVRMMQEFSNTNGLIIDVRGNGGGSRTALQMLFPYFMPVGSQPIVANVGAYRLSEDFPSDHLAARDLYRADDARWNDAQRQAIERVVRSFTPQWRPPHDEFSDWHYFVLDRPLNDAGLYHYDRPVVILMNEECFSATDIFLGAFKTAAFPNVKLVGTASGGGSGRKQAVRLNNSGIVIELSSMISFLPSGEMYDRNGIQPDVIVKPIATDFIGQTDSAVDEAIALIRK